MSAHNAAVDRAPGSDPVPALSCAEAGEGRHWGRSLSDRRWGRWLIAWGLRRATGLARAGRPAESLKVIRRLAALAPDSYAVQVSEARYASSLGEKAAAKAALRRAIPASAAARHGRWCSVAAFFLRLEDADAAEACLLGTKAAHPASPRVWALLGDVHRHRADTDEAVKCFERSLALATGLGEKTRALNGLAECLGDAGRKDDAALVYRRLIELSPEHASAYPMLVNCQKGAAVPDELTQSMLGMLAANSLGMVQKMNLHYALGTLHDDRGRYAEAFAHFMVANDYRSRIVRKFDAHAWEDGVDRRIEKFDRDLIQKFAKFGCQEDFLICILGMPRSGTTLTEQILSSHPEVAGLGERQDFHDLTLSLGSRLKSRLAYPMCCKSLSQKVVRQVSAEVREDLMAAARGRPRVVTKLPGDCWDVGLIKILFPKARIVHCSRHPIDTCLSCFMQNFAYIPYATDLVSLSLVYRAYQRIMRHWAQVLPAGSIYECVYERTVTDPETGVRGLHGFCGLPFNEDWSRFPGTRSRAERESCARPWRTSSRTPRRTGHRVGIPQLG